ncbi:MAG TPA: hypothetical protein VL337_00205 [Acidimicrobiales bacterium]|jgi:hypothetical protein|nr:hypothetical protein [Acidimicrobiales bacterium]
MAKNKLLASVALAGGLAVGGAAGLILGVPGVSGAQTTTVPSGPSTTAPGGSQTTPDRPHDGNCPNMGGQGGQGGTTGQAPASGAATNTGFRHGGWGAGARF